MDRGLKDLQDSYTSIIILDRDDRFVKCIYIPILNNEPVIIIWRGRYFVHVIDDIYKESMTLLVEEGAS